jgi:hypothetical protein
MEYYAVGTTVDDRSKEASDVAEVRRVGIVYRRELEISVFGQWFALEWDYSPRASRDLC